MDRTASTPFNPPRLPRYARPSVWPWPLRLGVAAAGLGALFLGVFIAPSTILSLMVAIAVLVPTVLVAWFYPELSVVILIFLASKILDPRLAEVRLPFGGGLTLPDLALLGLLGVAVLRQVLRHDVRIPTSWALPPLLIFLWLAVISAMLAVLFWSVEVSWALSELRGLVYYAVFILVLMEVRQREQLKRLLIGLFVIGLVTVSLMLVQQFVGSVPLFGDQASSSWQIVSSDAGVTRIRPPGHVLLYFLSIAALVLGLLVRGKAARTLLLGIALFMNAALLLTFTRSQWVASGLAFAVCFLLFPNRVKAALTVALVAVVAITTVAITAQRAEYETFISSVNFATPLIARVESVFQLDQTLDSYSAQTRYFQTGAALDAIQAQPLTGVGLGNAYRGLTPQEAISRYTRFVRFIENSYLYLTTKMGVPALLVFAWLALAVLVSAWHNYQTATDPMVKAVSLACLASFAGILIWGFMHPLLMLSEYTIMVGLIAGISEAIGPINRNLRGEAS